MPKSEWRLFLPLDDTAMPHPNARTLMALVEDEHALERTDVYLKADADVGVKRRGDGGLEFKYLKERRVLGGGVGPGTAEKFKKVRLGDGSTPAEIIEHLRNEGNLTENLERLLKDPIDVEVRKKVRRKAVNTGEGDARLEVSEVSVSCAVMPEDYPRRWLTFCVEGSMESVSAFLGTKEGKLLVTLMSQRKALQVGYPQFVRLAWS